MQASLGLLLLLLALLPGHLFLLKQTASLGSSSPYLTGAIPHINRSPGLYQEEHL